jgi:hypothetical protein
MPNILNAMSDLRQAAKVKWSYAKQRVKHKRLQGWLQFNFQAMQKMSKRTFKQEFVLLTAPSPKFQFTLRRSKKI